MQQPYVIKEDIWIDSRTGLPVREGDAVNGAFRLNAGERISNEDAEKYGLKKSERKAADPAEDKAEVPAEDKAVEGPKETKRKTARKR